MSDTLSEHLSDIFSRTTLNNPWNATNFGLQILFSGIGILNIYMYI